MCKSKFEEINRFHRLLGHASEESMRRTAKHYNVQLTGKFEACEDCQKSNVAQRSVKKTTDDVSTRFGERLCIDSSSVVEHQSLGGGKVWLCVVDDHTGYAWGQIMKRKSDTVENVMEIIRTIQDWGFKVDKIRCDDAGENVSLKNVCKESKVPEMC